jgi:hypothetical protein
MDRRMNRRVLALLASGMLAACSSGGTAGYRRPGGGDGASDPYAAAAPSPGGAGLPLDARPFELPGKPAPETDDRARRRVREGQAFYEEKLDVARAYAAEGDDETALRVVAAALALQPRSPYDERLRALRAEIRAKHVEAEVLRADVRGVKDYVPFGADVDVVVRLRNVGPTDVVIRPPDPAAQSPTTGTAFFLTVTRRDRDIYAATLVRTWTQVLPLAPAGAAEIVIPPAGVHETRMRIPAEDAGGAISGLRHLDVSGEVRADRIECGVAQPFGRIPIRRGRVVALPGNFEPLAADPVESIRRSASLGLPVHLLVATEFVGPNERLGAVAALAEVLATGRVELRTAALNALSMVRASAVGAPLAPLSTPLMEALAAHPERSAAVMDGLRTFTGVSLAPDARLWEDWWRRVRQAPAAPVPAEDDLLPKSTDPKGPSPASLLERPEGR